MSASWSKESIRRNEERQGEKSLGPIYDMRVLFGYSADRSRVRFFIISDIIIAY